MADLSEESLFLARNWETVSDILDANEKLDGELLAVLSSLQPALGVRPWWSDAWEFRERKQYNDVYIAQRSWLVDKTHAIWIGIERFNAWATFGKQEPPLLYVWVLPKQRELAQSLAGAIGKAEQAVLGHVDPKVKGGYLVRQEVQKCLPEAIDGYTDRVRQQALEFMEHYAKVLSGLEDLVQQHLTSGQDAAPKG